MDIGLLEELMRYTEQNPSWLSRQASGGNGHLLVEGKSFLGDEELITVRADTSSDGFPEHTHDYIEIVYLCKGSATHIINGERVRLEPGDFLFLSQNSHQENLPCRGDNLAINFIVKPNFFRQILVMLGDKETLLHRFIIECLMGERGKAVFLRFRAAEVYTVQNLIENLIWNLLHGSHGSERINELTVSLLLLQLMNNIDVIGFNGSREPFIFKVLDYIEKNYADGNLTQLSEMLYYDVNALSKQIKHLTGKTYTQLVQEKRLSKACSLLRNTDLGVKEIAQLVGYDNISYFHRLFFKTFGMSPKKYRDKGKT